MTSSSDKFVKLSKPRKLPKPALIALITVAAIGLAVWGVADYLFHNKAADIAAPLEKSLVAAGATKECSTGDVGRGPDNTAPWYISYYDTHMSKDDATSLINNIAKDNGYNLTHASPTNRGHLSAVADIYINKWYFDDSKQQPYGDIEAGVIQLDFAVDGPGSSNGCKTSGITQSGHEMIRLSVYLPEFKH